MQARYVRGLTIRQLRNGDTDTIAAVFERLGSVSRQRRFCGAKPRLSDDDLAVLARVDETHHVLVAYVDGSDLPQHSEVLGHLWLSQAESAHEIVHRALAAGEDVQDLSPSRLCHCVERIRRRRCPSHSPIIYPYRNMSNEENAGVGSDDERHLPSSGCWR